MTEAALNAYGWTGPWKDRRGFDTLVRFSSGLAHATTAWALADPEHRTPVNALGRLVDSGRPRRLPVEALDFAEEPEIRLPLDGPYEDRVHVGRGGTPVRRLRFPVTVEETPLCWERPFEAAGRSAPTWCTVR
ncbi:MULTISPECIES: hypothetical protein [Streptomyces]|uniref:Uncharacterized protein n=1 Tax=Streptomyces caniscabiei TaxID=2746961 RepID=A0ABU4N7I7_9ACTN|nr:MULTISPECIES: hypothetical protein [Streptomyces]MBE4740338.1 hypothetical protein [Streptomyces caniscabiei]MBE4759590.1 hypothetical protein [Streptomyces caniscabiei]MBE4773126.1 hypothetical protein [Streptomyces caniscabiei]MBE4788639.1 hypothetical protein [Streptomyces caniscabiei]MBE4797881.1 hypothetical protein [Streptomyces caniscabiei]